MLIYLLDVTGIPLIMFRGSPYNEINRYLNLSAGGMFLPGTKLLQRSYQHGRSLKSPLNFGIFIFGRFPVIKSGGVGFVIRNTVIDSWWLKLIIIMQFEISCKILIRGYKTYHAGVVRLEIRIDPVYGFCPCHEQLSSLASGDLPIVIRNS